MKVLQEQELEPAQNKGFCFCFLFIKYKKEQNLFEHFAVA